MNKSGSITNLAKALSGFQAEVKNPANTATNPHFKSKYAPLSDILNDVRPILSKHGLSVIQSPGGDGEKVSITTLLMHISGEWIEADPLVLKADKPTAQGAGSGITYARRYSLSSVLGISSEDDDDGNQAGKQQNNQGEGKPCGAKQGIGQQDHHTQPQEPPKEQQDQPKPEMMVMGFGKNNGKTLGAILKEDKSYIEWLAKEARDPALKAAAKRLLEDTVQPELIQELVNQAMLSKIHVLKGDVMMSDGDLHTIARDKYGVDSLKDLTKSQGSELIKYLEAFKQ